MKAQVAGQSMGGYSGMDFGGCVASGTISGYRPVRSKLDLHGARFLSIAGALKCLSSVERGEREASRCRPVYPDVILKVDRIMLPAVDSVCVT
jgi:hypothetical protein